MATDDPKEEPSATVYISNLNERIKIPRLIAEIRDTFEASGNILDIIAKKNVKAKGQAFVVFETAEEAAEAIDLLQDYEIFGKEMKLAYAKTRSDVTVKQEDGEEALEAHKRHRLAEKERKQAIEAQAAQAAAAKRPAADTLVERPVKATKPAAGEIPDEYLPPNRILFLREVHENYGKVELTAVFGRYPGFKEVRMVPSRKGIAFVEYDAEEGAIAAKEATAGIELEGKPVRVTFQKK